MPPPTTTTPRRRSTTDWTLSASWFGRVRPPTLRFHFLQGADCERDGVEAEKGVHCRRRLDCCHCPSGSYRFSGSSFSEEIRHTVNVCHLRTYKLVVATIFACSLCYPIHKHFNFVLYLTVFIVQLISATNYMYLHHTCCSLLKLCISLII